MTLLGALERRLFALPDRVIVDSQAHATAWQSDLGLRSARTIILPASAPEAFRSLATPYQAEPISADRPLRILYAGQYIPLHGVEIILAAADRLRHRPDIRFELVGQGQTLPEMRSRAEALSLPNLHFVETWLPSEQLARDHLAPADLCLGIFGTQAKAQRVVPFKVYTALAAGRPVITADTPAARELLRSSPTAEAQLVPPGDPQALAAAIEALADTPHQRQALAERGQAAWDNRFAPATLGQHLRLELETLVAGHAPGAPQLAPPPYTGPATAGEPTSWPPSCSKPWSRLPSPPSSTPAAAPAASPSRSPPPVTLPWPSTTTSPRSSSPATGPTPRASPPSPSPSSPMPAPSLWPAPPSPAPPPASCSSTSPTTLPPPVSSLASWPPPPPWPSLCPPAPSA